MSNEVACSFCRKFEGKVKALMAAQGTSSMICNECIRVSRAVLSVDNPSKVIPFPNAQRIG